MKILEIIFILLILLSVLFLGLIQKDLEFKNVSKFKSITNKIGLISSITLILSIIGIIWVRLN